MAAAKKKTKADPVMEKAADYFAGRSHDAWRKTFHKTNPAEKAKPRMRMRGGEMVDVNQPWSKLHPAAKQDNLRAARDAYVAVRKFPKNREAASDLVHKAWIKANKRDPSQPKDLFRPYAQLPEVEKNKDRAHVDAMRKAIAAVAKKTPKQVAKARAKSALPKLEAKAWGRLEAAAKDLSKALGLDVSAEMMAVLGMDAMASLAETLAARSRSKRG
jgi:hypothetical protein